MCRDYFDNLYTINEYYLSFLNYAKTEYRCVEYFKMALEEAGFKDINSLSEG